MTQRAPDVDRISVRLDAAEMRAVGEWCVRSGVPLAHWPNEGALSAWVDLAVLRAVDAALADSKARSFTQALRLVCLEFRLSFDAYDRRFRRQRRRRKKADRLSAPGHHLSGIVRHG